jgi:ribosome modulation factor
MAMREPEGFKNWNRALRGAYIKGYQAAIRGDDSGSCPYADKRKYSGGLTWSRSFISAWDDGYRAGVVSKIPNFLGRIMIQHNLNATQVARILGCTPSTVRRWRCGLMQMPERRLEALRLALSRD